MSRLTRRSFLAAAGALASSPAFGATQQKRAGQHDADVVIIGAGAAGIAAARRIVAAGRTCVVLEASTAVGGRCATDTTTFGVPVDLGARVLHRPETNPVAKLAMENGFDVTTVPQGQQLRIGRRFAREADMERMLAAMVRANTAIADAARKVDVACAQVLPKDLGEWRATIEFMLGPYQSGKDLADVSTVDFARAADRDVQAYCRQGLGAVMAKLAADLPVRLATPALSINWYRRAGVEIETAAQPKTIEARAAIVTASTNVLSAGKLKFAPDLPHRLHEAIAHLRLGSYDRITLGLPGNPLGLRSDELVFEKAASARTAALFANVAGSTVCSIDVGGRFGRELAAKGTDAMVAFALDWLASLFGRDLKSVVRRSHVTRWNDQPYVLGAMSAAAPGGQSARRTLMDPLAGRVWFAGEAVHERHCGTVAGAWESGERAATAVLRAIAARPVPEPPRATPQARSQPKSKQPPKSQPRLWIPE